MGKRLLYILVIASGLGMAMAAGVGAQDDTGAADSEVVGDGSGVADDGSSVIDDATGEVDGGAGVIDEGSGIIDEGTSVVEDGTEVVDEGSGIIDNATGVIDEGSDVVDEGIGVIDEGTGVIDGGTGVIDEGTEVIDEGGGVIDEGGEAIDFGEEEFIDDSEFISGDDFTEEEYFDPAETTYDEWFGSDEAVDWDGDGEFSEEDYDLLTWLTGESTAEDVDGDGFLDEEDYALSQWLEGSADSDVNGDGAVDEDDFTLYQQETQGIFVNEIYYVFAETDHKGASIYWYSSEPGGSDTLRYREAEFGTWQAVSVSSSGYEHLISLSGLKADTEYDFGARSLSPDGFVSDWVQDAFRTRKGADLRPAVGSDLDVQVTGESATLSWFTNRSTDAGFTITREGQVVAQGAADQEGQQAHDVFVGGLEAGTEYQFTLSSTPVDEAELVAEGLVSQGELVDVKSGRFITPGQPQALQFTASPFSVVSSGSAVIEVALNQITSVSVDYGRADNILEKTTAGTQVNLYKEHVRSDQRLTQHSITLSGLKPKTTYRYRITALSPQGDTLSTDPFGDQQWNYDWQFTTSPASDTLPPVIVEGPRVVSRDKIAVVEWTTDVETTGKVFIGTQGGTYGTPDEFVFVDRAPGGAPAFAQRHVVTLTALDSATTYAYRIESAAANGKSVVFSPASAGAGKLAKTLQPPGGSGTFKTSNQPDTQFPVILSGPTITSRGRDRAVVEWTTDEPANSVVRFGRDRLDGNVSAGDNEVEHKLVLSNLQPGASYKFVINSTDASGNGATQSAEAFFTTNPDLDLAAPRLVSGPEVMYKNDRSAAIRWTTDEAATGQVSFGTTAQLGSQRNLGQAGLTHEISLTNLSPATTYFYKVSASDLSNNGPTSSQVLSFTTEAQPDLQSPVVSGVEAVPSDSVAIIRWTTDEVGDSFVEFGTSEAVLGDKAGDDKDLSAHEVVLTHLRPSTTYFYRAGSVDRADNPAGLSQVQSFATLATADRTAPQAPAGLKAQAGAGQASISWTASTDANLAGYNLYRRSGEGSFAPVATRLSQTSYVDLGLTDGQAYEYRLTAIDRALVPNESLPSSTITVSPSAATAPTAPTQLGQEGSLFSPTLKFTNAAPHTQGAALTYIIQVSSDSSFGNVVASVSGLSEGSGGAGPGRTAWMVDRRLQEDQTYYWRARAVEDAVNGPFSESRQFKTQRPPAVLAGDFNSDKTVNFDDFFLFADNFGKSATGEAAKFDLSKSGNVDFDDFFLFADNFGKSASAKRWAAAAELEREAVLGLEAVASGEARQLVVEVSADRATSLQAFGLVLAYDPRLVQFQRAQRGGLVQGKGLFAVLHQEPGEVVLGGSLAGGKEGELAELHFTLIGPADQVAIALREALVSRPGAQVARVEGVPAAHLRPASWFLRANYPNPFNPSTAISYGLAQAGPVKLSIYDVLGQQITVLVEAQQPAGFYQVVWDGADAEGRPAGNGMYFYLLQTPQFTQARKMALIK
ncbi:MAG: fibronectin type III domain-containing protein [Candidatus Latescibacteria bacterium]|nr:fibronectin type III domain-containing protein [Candidatus Latescibacterota bacterium]